MRRPASTPAGASIPPGLGSPAGRYEWSMNMCEAWVYLTVWTSITPESSGRCETKNGIAPFDRLVEQVMTRPPYEEARHESSGLSTTARRTAARGPCRAYRLAMLDCGRSTRSSVPVSSTRSKFISPSSNARCPPRTTSPDLNSLAERLLDFHYYWEKTLLRMEVYASRPHGS